MTSPSGSIGIGITIDAGDLTTEITKAVQSAMSGVLGSVQSGMGQVESAIAGVDTSGFSQVAEAAAQSMEDVAKEVGDSTSTAARSANAALSDIDAKPLEEVEAAADDTAESVEDVGKKSLLSADNIVKFGAIAAGGIAAAGTALFALGSDFASMSNNIRIGTGASGEAFEGLVGIAKDLGSEVPASFEDIGSTVADLNTRLGLTGDPLQTLSRQFLELNNMGIDTDINGIAASFQAFGVTGEDTAGALDELFQVSQATGLGVSELAAAAVKGGPALRDFGFGLGESAALAGTLDKAGLDATSTFGAMQRAMVSFAEEGKSGEEALFGTVSEIENMIEAGNTAGAIDIAGKVFGTRGAAQFVDAIKAGTLSVDDFVAATGATEDTILGLADETRTFSDQWVMFKNEAMASLEPVASRVFDVITTGMGWIKDNAVPALKDMATWVGDNKQLLADLGVAVGVVTVALTALVVQQKIAAAGSFAKFITGIITSTKAWTIAQTALNFVLNANPIGIIVLAIAALVGALVIAYRNSETFRDIVQGAWEGIQSAVGAAWDFISPVFDAIKTGISAIGDAAVWLWNNAIQPAWDGIMSGASALGGVFNSLVGVVSSVFNTIGAVISAVWNNVISPIFNFWHTMITGVLIPIIMFLWNSVIAPAFNGIGSIISTVWNTVINVIFTAFRAGMDAIGAAANWLWNNVIMPVWDGIAATISFVWNNLIMPVFDGIKAGMSAIGDAATWLWQNVITPVWDGIGNTIRWVIDNVITPAWEGMKSGLQAVGDFFSTVVDGIGNVWNGLRNLLAKPINFLIGTVYNDGIRKAWNKIGEFIPGLVSAPEIGLIPEYATGGRINGPGSGTSDDVLMWGSNGEHMVTAAEVLRAGGHNVLYAIRDMIARGIPFEWDNGRVISKVGESNMSRYGAAVQSKGLGNVAPEGLFDTLLPKFKDGGAIVLEPWMLQLAEGHKFAQAQHRKPYQWAGPRFVNDSFDCSGFMGSIAAAILGGNPWQRYWATSSFAGYPAVGAQGFTRGSDAGFTVGITDDPGGPGGGHTAGVLGAVPGMFGVARVESGGAIGDVHYGMGTDPTSFASIYHLPIGANGFFQPGAGGSIGPSPEEQRGFIAEQAGKVLRSITDPIKGLIVGSIGEPPPHWKSIPPRFLDGGVDAVVGGIDHVVGNLGDMLSSAWTSAKSIGGSVLDALNPFDSGGIARGLGFMPKNTIAPERVLSPEQTKLFETLVAALESISNGGVNNAVVGELGDIAQSVRTLVAEGDYDGVMARYGVQEDHQIVDAVLTMREVATSVDALVNKGDYDGTMSRFGIQEDHPVIDAVLTMREVATSVDALVNQGDYDGTMSRFGVQEDHPLVDAVLSVREVAQSIDTLVRDGDYDGTMSRFGVHEDHPVVDAVLDVRDAVVAADEHTVKVATDVIEALGNSASTIAVDLIEALGPSPRERIEQVSPDLMRFMDDLREEFNEQGELISSTESQARRSESSAAQVLAEQYRQLEAQVLDVSNRLSSGVLGPVVQTAMQSALGVVNKALVAATEDVTAAQGETTEAVKGIDTAGDDPEPPFGAPGSAFDLAAELSDMVVSVANTASDSLMQLGMDIAKAALEQQKSEVDNPRGVLGDEDNSGGTLVDTIVRLTGVEIQIRDTIYAVAADVKAFRGDQFQTFDETGQLLSDTASMLERSASSTDMVLAEQNRINRELMKSVMRYLMVNVLLPVLSALLTALITIAVTLVAAAIGAMIAGPIGLAIGAALGAVVGLALSAVAAGVIGSVGLGAAAAIDSFDEGGVANGIGIMPKNTIAPERVLSPRQTASFDRLVDLLDARGIGGGGNKSVHVGSVNVHGTQAAEKSADHLLSLLNS